LSSYGQRSYVEKMMNAGASAYLHKNAEPAEIIEAIDTVFKGDTYYSSFIKDVMNTKSDSKNHSSLPLLTGRETQILILVAEGLTNQEIADKLFISQQTAISHRKNLLIKFNARNTAELVKLALQSGLIG
jgi:DNA-binding NarL/FixJ family response regulator